MAQTPRQKITAQILAPRCEPHTFGSREEALAQARDWASRYDELVDVTVWADDEQQEQITFGRDGNIKSTWKRAV